MTTPTPIEPGARDLDESDLDAIVGGAGAAQKRLAKLVSQDLDDGGADGHADDIAKMIAGGQVSAKDALGAMEKGAARDGEHSLDQQLSGVFDELSDLKGQKADAGAAAFAKEMASRLNSGEAADDLGRLVNDREISGKEAVSILTEEAADSRSKSLGDAMMRLEKTTHGDDAVETALGKLVAARKVSAQDAIHAVTAGATSGKESVDEALMRLNAGAGGDRAIEAELAERVDKGLTGQDLVASLRHGNMSEKEAVQLLAAEVAKRVLTQNERSDILLKLAGSGEGSAESVTAVGQLVKSGQIDGADAAAAVEHGAIHEKVSVDQALARLEDAAGRNADIQAEQTRRLASGDTVADLGEHIRSGEISGPAALKIIAEESKASGRSMDVALLALNKASGHDQTIKAEIADRLKSGEAAAELGRLVTDGKVMGRAACETIASLAAAVGQTPGVALLDLERQSGGDPSVERRLADLVLTGGLDAAAFVQSVMDAAGPKGPVDAALLRAGDLLGPHDAVTAAIQQRVDSGATAAGLAQEVRSGEMSGRAAADAMVRLLDAAGACASYVSQLAALGAQLTDGSPALAKIGELIGQGLVSGWDATMEFSALPPAQQAIALFEINAGVPGGSPEILHAVAAAIVDDQVWNNHGGAGGPEVVAAIGKAAIDAASAAGASGESLSRTLDQIAGLFVAEVSVPGGSVSPTCSGLQFIMAAAGSSSSSMVVGAVADQLLGDGPAKLAGAVASGTISAEAAMALASDATALVQQNGKAAGVDRLPNALQAAYVLAKFDAAAGALADRLTMGQQAYQDSVLAPFREQAHQVFAFFGPEVVESTAMSLAATAGVSLNDPSMERVAALHASLQETYGIAIATGSTVAPLVDALGIDLARLAISAGDKLGAIADPTTGEEAKLIVQLEDAVGAAGGSIDAALALANLRATGRSEILKLEMTDRLLSGKTTDQIASLALEGKISADEAAGIVAGAVGTLAAGSAMGAALGFDRETALGLTLAKLDLAVREQGFGSDQALAIAGAIEAGNSKAILTGLGAIVGDLSFDKTANADKIYAAQDLFNTLLPQAVAIQLAEDRAGGGGGEAVAELEALTDENVQGFVTAYEKAYTFKEFQREWIDGGFKDPNSVDTPDDGKPSTEVSVSLQTYQFTTLGAEIGVKAEEVIDLGAGFNLTLSAEAGAKAGIDVNATQVTIEAAAIAAAKAEFDLGGHARVTLLAQAIASGSVQAGVTGVAVKGNVAAGASVEIEQKEEGSLGNGFEGMQSTTLTAGVVAGASGNASIGLNNDIGFGAKAGAYASAGQEFGLSYSGVEIGGGATIMSPGAIGVSADVSISFEGGDISIAVGAFIGVALFGAEFNFDLKLPTGEIVDALKGLGDDFENFGEDVGSLAESIAGEIAGAAQDFGEGAQDFFEDDVGGFFEDDVGGFFEDVGSIY